MNCKNLVLALFLVQAFAIPALPQAEPTSVEGAVVAVQRGKVDTRIDDPNSMADLAEMYMVRADHWLQPHTEKYIIVEYIHRSNLISYEKFDKTLWRFAIRQASPDENKDCLTWMARGPSFLPTAFGAKIKLPDPKTLGCFLTREEPIALQAVTTKE